jgi:hypothetical protein
MTADFDLVAEVAAGVRDTAGAWRFIRRFAAACTSPLTESDGFDDDELDAAETRLGFPLPAALRELYKLVGRRDELTREQDDLLMPEYLRVEDDEVLVFRIENQSVAYWGVAVAALAEPDPPVVFRLNSRPTPELVWQPFMDRVSLAAVEMVLSEWMWSGDLFHDNRDLDGDAVAALEKRYTRLPMPDYPLWAIPDGPPMRWFCDEGTVLRVDAGEWVWIRAESAEALAAVRQALPGDWLMVSD